MGKRKADCTPEEWEKRLEYHREWQRNHPRKTKKDYTEEEWEDHLKKQRERYAKNPGKKIKSNNTKEEWNEYLTKKREYYSNNKEHIVRVQKTYKQKHRAKFLELQRIYNRRRREKNPNYDHERYIKNIEKNRAYGKQYRNQHKKELSKYQKEYRIKNVEKLKEYSKSEKVKHREKKYRNNNKLLYIKWAHQLTVDEDPIQDKDGYMLVRDYHTKEYFYPKQSQITKRIQSLKGNTRGENHLYSSEESKNACPIYGAVKYPKGNERYKKGTQSRDFMWRDMVISRADGHCERCGKESDSLIAHHKVPVASCAMMAADVDNGIALCPECHKEVHSTDGCRLHELAAEKRETA